MNTTNDISGYIWNNAERTDAHDFILPELMRILSRIRHPSRGCRILDLGCGNGSISAYLASHGWIVTGVDPSTDGIRQAKKSYPDVNFYHGSAYDDLAQIHGTFPIVISLEVIEHVYSPREFARTVKKCLEPGGVAIISTPYHSYLKNLALALSGRMDAHFTALWDHGHIKFWSTKTISALLSEADLHIDSITRVGRVPALAKSMIITCR